MSVSSSEKSLSSVAKSSFLLGSTLGMCVLTCPIAVKGLTLCLLTRMLRPFLRRSRVPLGNTLVMRYGPSHLSSIFSLVLRKRRLSRKTNCPGFRITSTVLASCLCLYLSVFCKAFLVATCLFKNKCRSRVLVLSLCPSGSDMLVEYLG